MIVLSVSVAGKLILFLWDTLGRSVVKGNTHDRLYTGHEQSWVESFVCMIVHIVHTSVPSFTEPSFHLAGRLLVYSFSVCNAAGEEAEACGLGFDLAREFTLVNQWF
jgi:hypothetical protein